MKQLLFLLLFPCLAMAQYQGNAGQKITLGEQTTADGLVFRGVANDTNVITPFSDTSAYIILDTVNSKFYHYNRTTTYWSLAGGGVSVTSFSAGTTGLTPSTATTGAVTLGGTLAVANGGTNTSTAFTAGSVVFAGASGTYTQNNSGLFWDNANSSLGIGTNTGTNTLTIKAPSASFRVESTTGTNFTDFRMVNTGGILYNAISRSTGGILGVDGNYEALLFYGGAHQNNMLIGTGGHIRFLTSNNNGTSYSERMRIASNGNVGIGTTSPQSGYRLHVVDSVYVGGRVSAAGYTTRSDYDLKDEIQTLNYGLNEVIQMQPVKYTYKSNGEQQLGFIAQDIGTLIPESVHFDEFMGVDYQSIIPILTKAIQEQNLLIKALEQRILTLENK